MFDCLTDCPGNDARETKQRAIEKGDWAPYVAAE